MKGDAVFCVYVLDLSLVYDHAHDSGGHECVQCREMGDKV
jgi:hypothetical protein